jgi:hypothetical protein
MLPHKFPFIGQLSQTLEHVCHQMPYVFQRFGSRGFTIDELKVSGLLQPEAIFGEILLQYTAKPRGSKEPRGRK